MAAGMTDEEVAATVSYRNVTVAQFPSLCQFASCLAFAFGVFGSHVHSPGTVDARTSVRPNMILPMENRRSRRSYDDLARRKPAGGFVFISGTALLSIWWAYRQGIVTLRDLRVWLACFELTARRCQMECGRAARYTVAELQQLTDSSSETTLRRSIGRLRQAGYLSWSESQVEAGMPSPGLYDDAGDIETFLGQVPNHRRKIPVPRRILRMLAKDGSKVMVATVFGHLLRCLYYRQRACRPSGTCKASWIAETFGVDLRNVKAARKALVASGLLTLEPRSQLFLNRYGSLVTVNLAWKDDPPSVLQSPPPARHNGHGLPPPNKNTELLRIKNQKPRPAAAGVCTTRLKLGPPDLRHVVPADLADPARLAVLHEQARKASFLSGTEADRLSFYASAEHAKAVGSTNIPGLFAAAVRRRLWSFVTQADENRAMEILRRYEYEDINRPIVARDILSLQSDCGATERIGVLISRLLPQVGRSAGHHCNRGHFAQKQRGDPIAFANAPVPVSRVRLNP